MDYIGNISFGAVRIYLQTEEDMFRLPDSITRLKTSSLNPHSDNLLFPAAKPLLL
jgi:hypothetical protein